MKNLKKFSNWKSINENDSSELQGWIIDYRSMAGPDYNIGEVKIIIAFDENEAINLLSDVFEIPENSFDVKSTLEDTVNEILSSDYYENEGWALELEEIKHFPNVRATRPGHHSEFYWKEDFSREEILKSGYKVEELIKKYIR